MDDMDTRPTELSLFSGTGGGLLATQHLLGFRTVCYVEVDAYCQRVLQARIADGMLDDAPMWDDVRTFDGKPWRGCVDLLSAGFPCQPFTAAGKRIGEHDERNLWPETIRVIREVGPRWCLLENVPGLLAHGYFGTILGDLAESGFDVAWKVLSAAELGAPHKRDRLWIVSNAVGEGQSDTQGRQAWAEQPRRETSGGGCWWDAEPDVGRVASGVASRVDRLRSLGNGQVPIVAATAFQLLSERLKSVQ